MRRSGRTIASTSPAFDPVADVGLELEDLGVLDPRVDRDVGHRLDRPGDLEVAVEREPPERRDADDRHLLLPDPRLSSSRRPGFMHAGEARRKARSGRIERGVQALDYPRPARNREPRRPGKYGRLLELSPVRQPAAMKPHPLAEALAVAEAFPDLPREAVIKEDVLRRGVWITDGGPRARLEPGLRAEVVLHLLVRPPAARPRSPAGRGRPPRRSRSSAGRTASGASIVSVRLNRESPYRVVPGRTARPALECGGEPVCDVEFAPRAALLRREDRRTASRSSRSRPRSSGATSST